MLGPGREPVEPFVIAALDRPLRAHRAQELDLPFHSRDRLRKNGDDVSGCLVRIVRSGHRTASQRPQHTLAWVCAKGHGPKMVGRLGERFQESSAAWTGRTASSRSVEAVLVGGGGTTARTAASAPGPKPRRRSRSASVFRPRSPTVSTPPRRSALRARVQRSRSSFGVSSEGHERRDSAAFIAIHSRLPRRRTRTVRRGLDSAEPCSMALLHLVLLLREQSPLVSLPLIPRLFGGAGGSGAMIAEGRRQARRRPRNRGDVAAVCPEGRRNGLGMSAPRVRTWSIARPVQRQGGWLGAPSRGASWLRRAAPHLRFERFGAWIPWLRAWFNRRPSGRSYGVRATRNAVQLSFHSVHFSQPRFG